MHTAETIQIVYTTTLYIQICVTLDFSAIIVTIDLDDLPFSTKADAVVASIKVKTAANILLQKSQRYI